MSPHHNLPILHPLNSPDRPHFNQPMYIHRVNPKLVNLASSCHPNRVNHQVPSRRLFHPLPPQLSQHLNHLRDQPSSLVLLLMSRLWARPLRLQLFSPGLLIQVVGAPQLLELLPSN